MTRRLLAVVVAATLVAVAGCGSSKPSYCSDRTNLSNSVKGLPGALSSGGVSGLQSQLTKVQSDASTLASSAKGDFPSQTAAITSSIDALSSAVKGLPSSPSATQLASVASGAANVVNSVKAFTDASRSKCD
jgi:hypothetical protein